MYYLRCVTVLRGSRCQTGNLLVWIPANYRVLCTDRMLSSLVLSNVKTNSVLVTSLCSFTQISFNIMGICIEKKKKRKNGNSVELKKETTVEVVRHQNL